ncbi:MAG: hypothetical protein ACI8S6_005155 [Myxococcota bacterium]|jgi:hypothetical protein
MPESHPPAQPHDALTPIFDDVWFLTGSVQFKPLMRLSRNMIVLRHDGELTLINSIRLDEAGLASLDALGSVAHVIKIGMHGMDDAWHIEHYGARHWTLDDLSADTSLPVPGLRVFRFEDTVQPEAALLLEREGGLLITCDSVQHWAPSDLMSPLAKLATRFMGFQNPAQIGPPWRKVQTPPGGSLKADFDRLASLPFDKLIGGHGGLLERDGAAVLKASIARTFPG